MQQIKQVLSDNRNVAFAYIFGSAAEKTTVKQCSDLDMAVYFYRAPDLEEIYRFMTNTEEVIGDDVLDLLVLNGCVDFVLRNEVLKGRLIFCRDIDIHAAFFSWTLRMYEDQMAQIERPTTGMPPVQ